MAKITTVKKMEVEGIRQLAIEIIVTILERLPKLIRDNDQFIREVLEMIFTYMVEIDPNVDAEWEKPKEGNTLNLIYLYHRRLILYFLLILFYCNHKLMGN